MNKALGGKPPGVFVCKSGHPRQRVRAKRGPMINSGGEPVTPVCPRYDHRGYWIPARARCRSLGRWDDDCDMRDGNIHRIVLDFNPI